MLVDERERSGTYRLTSATEATNNARDGMAVMHPWDRRSALHGHPHKRTRGRGQSPVYRVTAHPWGRLDAVGGFESPAQYVGGVGCRSFHVKHPHSDRPLGSASDVVVTWR